MESSSDLADRQLLRCVARGDESAFGELYQRYGASVYNYLLRLIRERSVAEEVLQETFVAVWEGAGRFRGRSRVSTWLFRIAHHKAVDWLRRLGPAALDEDDESLPAGDCPEEAVEVTLCADRLQSALAHLSFDHRAALEAVFFYGLSYREAARVLGCPVGTVKSRIHQAKRQLVAWLKREGVESSFW